MARAQPRNANTKRLRYALPHNTDDLADIRDAELIDLLVLSSPSHAPESDVRAVEDGPRI